ncbi:MAG: hypothetical protein JSS07_09500 [Proteobacteria bacterium]|nr:hypothetical protein [Pseudomonadota bacterium]
MQYKGFVASYHYVSETGLFVAEIFNASDTISFSASSLTKLKEAMIEAVEDYLTTLTPPQGAD